MATNSSSDNVVDYLEEYRRYFEEFVGKINPEDQLPMKVNAYSITESELVGEIIYLTLQYIKQPRCPRSLQGYLVRLVLQEIKELCKKQPEECGFKPETKTYAPLKLMQAVTSKVNEIFTRYLDNNRLAMLPPPSSKMPPIARSAAFKNGKRKMEDRHIEIYDLHTICNVQNDSLASYFAVFDGHGGEDAAVYCATHLHQYLAESIYYPTDPKLALCDAFHTTDTRFIEKDRTQRVIGGSTAVCVLLLDKKLYIAWVGDSLAMLVKRGKVEELVYPHRLSRRDESERIQQMGGILAYNQGTMRVNGVLAVSRAIGDVQYKPYVTSLPDTRCVPLDGTEDFLIIATDGVWDFISAHEAAAIIYIAIRQYPDDPDYAVTSLIKAAKYAGSLDNITAIVVYLTEPSEIAARPSDAHPLLSLDSMINMAVNNPYVQKDLCAIDGMFFKQMKQFQQHPPPYDNNDQEERHANGSEASMDDGGFHDEISPATEGKHAEEENDTADYIYGDLGPETDVDAVDDVDNVLENPILDNAPNATANLSKALFQEEKRLFEKNENNFQQEEEEEEEDEDEDAILGAPRDGAVDTPLDDDDSPPSPVSNDTKPLQHALLPEADNVADSEDSEDEWNYYRVGPNKEKDTTAATSSDELHEIKNDNEAKSVQQLLDEDNNVEEPQSPASEVNSECESQKEEISPELINTDISVEEKREADSPFLKAENKEEEEEEKRGSEKGDEEEEEKGEEDMEFQLNPNAAEFIPGSPPKHQIKLNVINDSLVAGSPLKSMAMDDIKIPSQKEFDEEISVRPREMEEKDSPNGDHISHSDYDFYTERQKITGVTMGGLDESEISSTKAEYGDESTMSSIYTTDLHKTGISTMEESFGEGECDIYNRDNPMTMSYTPCDFKAAFKKEVDLNAVHDLSDGDLEDENGSFEEQIPRSPTATSANMEHRTESSGFSNGDSSDQVQSFSGSLQNETAFLKFEDSDEPKTAEFMQVGLERHQSSPIDPVYGQNVLKQEEDSNEVVNTIQREESEQMETHKEAKYVEDEKDVAESDTERVVEKSEAAPFQDHNFLSSTIREPAKSVSSMESSPKSVSSIEAECDEASSKPLDTDVVASMENLVLATEEVAVVTSSLRQDVPEFLQKQNYFDPYTFGEPLSSDVAKTSHLDDSMDLMAEPTTRPGLISESVSDERRPNESLLDFSDTATEVIPTKDHIEKSSLLTVEESAKIVDESVCLFDVNEQTEAEKQTNVEVENAFEELVGKTEEMHVNAAETVNKMPTLNLSESIQEFTGLEKQLEPDNVTPEESPMSERPIIEEKMTVEIIDRKEEPLVKESIEEKMTLVMEEEEEKIVKVEENPDVVRIEEAAFSNITEFVAPVGNVETKTSAEAVELATAADITETATPVDTAEIAMPADTVAEIATPADTAEVATLAEMAKAATTSMNVVESVETATILVDTTATAAKTGEIVVETAKVAETLKAAPTEQKTIESSPATVKSKVEEVAKPVAVGIVAAAAVGVVAAAATSTNRAKAKPGTKTTKSATSSRATSAPKSTPTSPSKTVSSTTRSTTSSITAKKGPTSTATRPKQLDTASAKTTTSATSTAKATATKTVPSSGSKSATSTIKSASARLSSATTKARPAAPTSARSTTALTDKKSAVPNGDVKTLSKGTTTKPASRSTTTTSATTIKSSTSSRPATASRTPSSATTTAATKPRASSATTAAKSPVKLSATSNTASSGATPTLMKIKTTPTSSSPAKPRTSHAKSPMIDKQIKETANKQISSMARTTTSSLSKTTTRTSASATAISSASATKRLFSSKSSTTTTAATHSPVKKITSRVASGNASGTKTSATSKVKVMQNGTAENAEIIKTTTTTTTNIITNMKNEDDVPKKDLSPVVAPTDNQLIASAD